MKDKRYCIRLTPCSLFLHSIMIKYMIIGVQSNIVLSQLTALHCMCKNAQEKREINHNALYVHIYDLSFVITKGHLSFILTTPKKLSITSRTQ